MVGFESMLLLRIVVYLGSGPFTKHVAVFRDSPMIMAPSFFDAEFSNSSPKSTCTKALFQEDAKHVATTDAQPDPVQEAWTSAVWIHWKGTHRRDGAMGVAAQDVSFAVLGQGCPCKVGQWQMEPNENEAGAK